MSNTTGKVMSVYLAFLILGLTILLTVSILYVFSAETPSPDATEKTLPQDSSPRLVEINDVFDTCITVVVPAHDFIQVNLRNVDGATITIKVQEASVEDRLNPERP